MEFATLNRNKNLTSVTIARLQLYFSYETIVAFRDDGKLTISKNVWSNTTGRHLSEISPDKSIRVDNDEFRKRLEIAFVKHGISPTTKREG